MAKTSTSDSMKTQKEEIDSIRQELHAFAYSVSHDLQGPIRVVTSFWEILQNDHLAETLKDPDAVKVATMLSRGISSLNEMMETFLRFSRIQRAETEIKILDLNEFCEMIVQEIRIYHINKDVSINFENLPCCPIDPSLMRIVFIELIGNSIKFAETDQSIRIAISSIQEETKTQLIIQDNGPGFKDQLIQPGFPLFNRYHGGTANSGTGSGLGISWQALKKQGWTLEIKSKAGNGTKAILSYNH